MAHKYGAFLLASIVAVISCSSAVATGTTYDFNDLTLSTEYDVGETFTSCGQLFEVTPFQWSNLVWTSASYATVWGQLDAGGSGLEIWPGNVNVLTTFASPVPYLSVLIGELGGNVNLEINGDFRNVEDFTALDGLTVGGTVLTVDVASTPGGYQGSLYCDGPVSSFKIGGQELAFDDMTVPEPTVLTALALGAVALLRRRSR